jgi:hypothetical protein
MSATASKWRVFKARGMWVVRKPGGAHFGAYFTWHEAVAQASRRSVVMGSGSTGGLFDRRGAWDYDTTPAFGFQPPTVPGDRKTG